MVMNRVIYMSHSTDVSSQLADKIYIPGPVDNGMFWMFECFALGYNKNMAHADADMLGFCYNNPSCEDDNDDTRDSTGDYFVTL